MCGVWQNSVKILAYTVKYNIVDFNEVQFFFKDKRLLQC